MLFEVKWEIPVGAVEAVDSFLLELDVIAWSVFEEVVEKRAWIMGIFENHEDADANLARLVGELERAGISAIGEPTTRTLADAEWRDSYKAHFRAWQFGRLHWVPIWERDAFKLPPGHAVLWLDPGLAFGTGNHETTRLCVERLVEFAGTKNLGSASRIIDAGCGSGILALSAALLGFADVVGFDNDPEAVRVSIENAALNDLSGRVRFFVSDLTSGLAPGQADLLMANIQADILGRFAREIVAAIAPGGMAVLSGILAAEIDGVRDAFSSWATGWSCDSRVLGEWCDLVLRHPDR